MLITVLLMLCAICDTGINTDEDPVVTRLRNENAMLRQEVHSLHNRIADLNKNITASNVTSSKVEAPKTFGYEYISYLTNRDAVVCHYTGLQTFELFD